MLKAKSSDHIHAVQSLPVFNILVALLILTILSCCSPRTLDIAISDELPEEFSISGVSEISGEWWTAFNDSGLNNLIDSALNTNFTLKSSWENLRAARFLVARESSGLWPSFETSLQGGIDYPQPDYVGGESFRLGLMSQYEVDLWGRIRSSIEAEEFRAQAALYDYQATALTLSAELARTWFGLAEAKKQLELVNQQTEVNETMLRLLRARLGSGLIRSVDVLRQKQLIESNNEQRLQVESEIEVLMHEMNVLLGRFPRDPLPDMPDSLPVLPPLPETGVPARLVLRRPDVQSVYSRLQAADKDLATAISSKYPRFSLVASTSVRANNLSQLFEDWAYSLAGNLLAPVFQGGALDAEASRVEAIRNQMLNEYSQSVLVALREVEDALVRETKQIDRIESLESQADIAGTAYKQLRLEYFNGMANYIDVLTALSQQQQLQRDLLTERMVLFMIRTSLYRALAGGIDPDAEEINYENL